MVQWLNPLPMQTWPRFLVREDLTLLEQLSPCATHTEPTPRAHTAKKSSPLSQQLEKAVPTKEDQVQPEVINKCIKKKRMKAFKKENKLDLLELGLP